MAIKGASHLNLEPIVEPSPIKAKRKHRTKKEMAVLEQRIIQAVTDSPDPMTVRGVYYRLAAITPPTESIASYNRIQRTLKSMREEGILPWEKIIDLSREIEFPYTWPSLTDYVTHIARAYRRELWGEADKHRVVVTLEKRALSERVREITNLFDVPFTVLGGYGSITVYHDLAKWISDRDPQHIYIYHFGDWNPSGENIEQLIEKKLHKYGAHNWSLERGAVTEPQIAEWNLFSRPVNDNDTRTPNFSGNTCTDLDALSKAQLQGLVRACIELRVDATAVGQIKQEEVAERKRLTKYASSVRTKDLV